MKVELLQMQNPIACRVGNTNMSLMQVCGRVTQQRGMSLLLKTAKESSGSLRSQGVETGLHLQELNLKRLDSRGALLKVLYSPFVLYVLYSPFVCIPVCVYSLYAPPHKGSSKKKVMGEGFCFSFVLLIDDIFIIYIFNIYINYKERTKPKLRGVRVKTRGVGGGRIRRIRPNGEYKQTANTKRGLL